MLVIFEDVVGNILRDEQLPPEHALAFAVGDVIELPSGWGCKILSRRVKLGLFEDQTTYHKQLFAESVTFVVERYIP